MQILTHSLHGYTSCREHISSVSLLCIFCMALHIVEWCSDFSGLHYRLFRPTVCHRVDLWIQQKAADLTSCWSNFKKVNYLFIIPWQLTVRMLVMLHQCKWPQVMVLRARASLCTCVCVCTHTHTHTHTHYTYHQHRMWRRYSQYPLLATLKLCTCMHYCRNILLGSLFVHTYIRT